ncbi:translation initiation factor IF-2 [Aeoliella mucimassa]|uniref:Translation initiation factor IF-2 n=1 Tax=Aeoliella mucimassa TaxID=2527972 RepID=A0A518AIU1_9BACT|nr:translation initiation factor IF-2 [Aeoliella mucimassa]QDU54637.1 Translation initiation factor IF-2 [Aeoliella mucimassa]
MAVRIYALAKELKLDSKELVDICTRAGIPGKGSALASLTEGEVTKVKQYLNGGNDKSPKASSSTKAPPAMERPKAPGSANERMKVIVTPRATSPLEAVKAARLAEETDPESEFVEETAVEQESQDQPTAEVEETASEPTETTAQEQPTEETPTAEAKSQESSTSGAAEQKQPESSPEDTKSEPGSGPLAGMLRREDYIGPGGAAAGKPPVVGRTNKPKPKREGGSQNRARPAIKLAPIPAPTEANKPKPKKKEEAKALKPDMKLPAEVLGGKAGSKPLAAHLRKAERSLEAERARKTGGTFIDGGGTDDDSKNKGKGKGPKGKGESDGRTMLGGREQRQLNRRRSNRKGDEDDSSNRGSRRTIRRTNRKSGTSSAAPRKGRVTVQLPCTVRDLSEAAGIPAMQIQRVLMQEGVMARINDSMDEDLTEFVAAELGLEVNFAQAVTLEDELLASIRDAEDPEDQLQPRPPVITFLGHVDHGKTSLLDRLIGINVVSGESGGITQHIRAYQIEKDGAGISFVDTPGHEAFTEMRARGANVTDIAVLVVAADDGVMPQTEEAISHAKAADVPIVVALNKIDIPGIDPMKAMADLSANGLQPSEWGGDIEVVKTSAITGEGMDDLLETLLTVADLNEYRANPNRNALGTSLESQQESGHGVVAKVIVQNGTLRVGDVVVCGDAYGRVRAMFDTLNPELAIEEAGPSTPVNLLGFNTAPAAGEHFYVLDDIAKARELAESREDQARRDSLGSTGPVHVTLENLFDRLGHSEEVQTLNLILRADVRGSIEAIQKELTKLDHPEVKLKSLLSTVGGVTEGDVQLAAASDAVILAFNVVPDEKARSLADKLGVQIRRYDVIYKITDDLKLALEGMLKPEEHEVELGRALVQQVFKISRIGTVAGCRVLTGTVERNARARVIRDSTVIGDYSLDTLRREKDDAKEVREGFECGIKLTGFNDVKEGDLFEVYKVEEIGRTFDN